MKKGLVEIRYHGRGGQGAKTLAPLFAEVAFSFGKHIQAFPEYGPERMGAPMQSFNRLSDKPIFLHCAVMAPDIVVVLDATLVDSANVFEGLSGEGTVIINTKSSAAEIKKKYNLSNKIYAIDASIIAQESMGIDKPNTPMLGVLIKIMGWDLEKAVNVAQKKLQSKYKPGIVKGNIKAIKKAYEAI